MEKPAKYHEAVMLKESTEALNINPEGKYVDVTFGGGSHSREILRKLKGGRLYAFDQDPDAITQIEENDNLVFINQNFRYLQNFLKMYNAIPVDGILADLGISSHQIDTEDRGFAFRSSGPLDMRMNRSGDLTAEKVVNEYSEEELIRVFREYGELKNARQVAKRIINGRGDKRITGTGQLTAILDSCGPSRFKNKFLAQVFQAIRIEVNGEMDALKDLLLQCKDVVKEGGIMAFITYHSLEDRLVKNFIKSGNLNGEIEKDFYGNIIKPFEAVNRKPIIPGEKEISLNNRARSAKLRIAKRIQVNEK